MLRSCLTTAVLGLLASSAARAELSYSYLDGAVAVTSEDTATLGNQDGKTAEIDFSYDILPFLHVLASYDYSEYDDLPIEGDVLKAGAGVHYNPTANKSIFFNLTALTTTFDVVTPLGTVSTDDDGLGYEFGYREINKNGRIEFLISAEHQELNDADVGDTWINMNLVFRATQRFKIFGGVTFAGDENAARVGVRYYLPNRLAQRD
jgi:hypothetical protein